MQNTCLRTNSTPCQFIACSAADGVYMYIYVWILVYTAATEIPSHSWFSPFSDPILSQPACTTNLPALVGHPGATGMLARPLVHNLREATEATMCTLLQVQTLAPPLSPKLEGQ